MQDFFELNLAAIGVINPKLALKLQNCKPNENFEVFIGDDVLNINIIDKRTNTPVFVDNPTKYTDSKIISLAQYSHYPYCIFLV